MKLPNDDLRGDAAAGRGGSGDPQPDFSAASSSAACRRGVLSSIARRKSTGSLPAFFASSSMKLSMAKTLLFGPTPRQKPVGTAGGSPRTYFDAQIGNVVGHVDGAVDGVDVDAVLPETPAAASAR